MEAKMIITLYRNLKKPGEGKNITITKSATFEQLLQKASEKLGKLRCFRMFL